MQKLLERSRKVNRTRIEIQRFRTDLIEALKMEAREQLSRIARDPDEYRSLTKQLILQGLIRLIEPKVKIMCLQRDAAMIGELLPEIEREYTEVMQKQTGRQLGVKLGVIESRSLGEAAMGGVVLYCRKYRIVYTNTF